jgi:hypothetical protein
MQLHHTVICGLSGCIVFSTLSHKRSHFRGKGIEHKMCASIFSTIFVSNIFHSKKNWARYDQKCNTVVMYSTRYSCQILMKLLPLRQIFELYSDIKFYENPSSGSPVVPRKMTDGQTYIHKTKLSLFAILWTLLKLSSLSTFNIRMFLHVSWDKQLPLPCGAFTKCSFSRKPHVFSVRYEVNLYTYLKVHSRLQQIYTEYTQVHLQIATTCFGVRNAILRDLYTKI